MTRKQRFAKAKEEALQAIEAIPAPNMSKVNLHEVFADCGQLANLETAAKRIIESYDNDTYIRPTNGLFPSLWGYEEYLDLYIDEDGIEAFRPILSEYIDSCTLDGLYDYLQQSRYENNLRIAACRKWNVCKKRSRFTRASRYANGRNRLCAEAARGYFEAKVKDRRAQRSVHRDGSKLT